MAGPGEASGSAVGGQAGKVSRKDLYCEQSSFHVSLSWRYWIPVRAGRHSAGGLVTRRYGVANTYEQLKEVTRQSLHAFIKGLAIPEPEKKGPVALMPSSYIGKAAELAKRI